MRLQDLFSAARNREERSVSLFPCVVRPDIFSAALAPAQKRELFKSTVNYVEFEPHAFCNRVCRFCPNSSIDRRSNKRVLSPQTYSKVLAELQEIAYAGTIAYARYSEPMARDEIFGMVEEARRLLPSAFLKIISNGDYLTPEKVDRLKSIGLDFLAVSLYMVEGTPWSGQAASEEISAFPKG
jgi:MoaA/NifB/PqqE/SkfB family radical SAM enzyme